MRGRWLTILVIVNLGLLGWGLWQLRAYAVEGRKARATQCRTFPVAVKLYRAAERYKLITRDDLKTYLAAKPRGCPP